MSGRVMLGRVMSVRVMSVRVMLGRVMSGRVMLGRVMSGRVMSGRPWLGTIAHQNHPMLCQASVLLLADRSVGFQLSMLFYPCHSFCRADDL